MRKTLSLIIFSFLLVACGGKKEAESPDDKAGGYKVHSEESAGEKNNEAAVGVRRVPVNNIGALSVVFNDSNFRQLEVAQRLGINPITDVSSAYFTGRPIVKVEDCEYYKIDELKHSVPYLVPEAAELLKIIGRNFRDSLAVRGGDSHLVKVTSLLRTPESVSRLRRVNVNATDSSTHQYATTFDLSYTNFYCSDSTRLINQGDLKNLLAEVLLELRDRGDCLVKYERKTGCFHVTVLRAPQDK